jgi:hypothetical protein
MHHAPSPALGCKTLTRDAVLSCGGTSSNVTGDHRPMSKDMLLKRREANWMSVANAASGGIGSCVEFIPQ